MGKFAKSCFGVEKFTRDFGIVVAGSTNEETEKKILNLTDEIIYKKDKGFHAYSVKLNNEIFPIVFNVYGAPQMIDSLTTMHDGGCTKVLFIGSAYGGFRNLDIASIVVPEKSFHFDGIYHLLKLDKKPTFPDKLFLKNLEAFLKKQKITYVKGTNISVPCVTEQPMHANSHYKKIKPISLEMELASFYTRAKQIGIRASAVLIISDNKSHSIDVLQKERLNLLKFELIDKVLQDNDLFNMPNIKLKKPFNVYKHLAAIIHDPNDDKNVYRDLKK